MTLMDHYSVGWNVLLLTFLECITIGYVYGESRSHAISHIKLPNHVSIWKYVGFTKRTFIIFFLGAFKYKEDIRAMIGNYGCCCFPWDLCAPWWILCWCFLTPIVVLV